MPEELGKIEKPSVDELKGGRKLYFVPLVFAPFAEPQPDLMERFRIYWEQVEAHVSNLEEKLGNVKKVYHELVLVAGDEGAGAIEKLNEGSYQIAKAKMDRGAELQIIEDSGLLAESLDWTKCLAVGLQSEKIATMVYGFYTEAQKRRNEYIARQIDLTLRNDEAGLLLMREGHQIQFSSDIHILYVAPPGLEEIRRWFREHEDES